MAAVALSIKKGETAYCRFVRFLVFIVFVYPFLF